MDGLIQDIRYAVRSLLTNPGFSAIAILTLMRTIARTRGMAVLCTLHQPPLAARFADRVVTMETGRLTA